MASFTGEGMLRMLGLILRRKERPDESIETKLGAAGLLRGTGLDALREYFGIHTMAAYRLLIELYWPAVEVWRASCKSRQSA